MMMTIFIIMILIQIHFSFRSVRLFTYVFAGVGGRGGGGDAPELGSRSVCDGGCFMRVCSADAELEIDEHAIVLPFYL